MISKAYNYMGHLESKITQPKYEKNLVNTFEANVLVQMYWKLVRKAVKIICSSRFNMDHLGSKGRSLAEIVEN
jgi:hypothetical protein